MQLRLSVKYVLGFSLCLGLAGLALRAISSPAPSAWQPTQAALNIDLNRPDAYIGTASLARLPRDLLQTPLLKDVLSEDFVDYYEHNPSRLSLAGALRRLAYEKDIDLGDELIASALDRPADVALWRGRDGALRYWLLAVERGGFGRVLQSLAGAALNDSQLHRAGELRFGAETLPLYALDYAPQQTLLLLGHGDRLLVFSDPALLLEANPNYRAPEGEAATVPATRLIAGRAEQIGQWLAADGSLSLRRAFQLPPTSGAGPRLALRADYLAFGYQAFFPALQALQFQFDGQRWQSSALLDAARWPASARSAAPLWQALPAAAALCTMLPIDAAALQPTTDDIAGKPGATQALLASIASPMATCWYPRSQLASPLFAVALKDAASAQQHAALLGQLFGNAIGAREFAYGKAKSYNRFPVQRKTRKDGGQTWQRIVSARYGSHAAKGFYLADSLSADRYYPVTLGVKGRYVYFSPDARLVDDALAVAAGQYPAASDGLAGSDNLWLRFHAGHLAKLLEASAQQSLPADSEPVFHAVAEQRLLPRLKALAGHPAYSARLTIPPGNGGWVALNWQAE